VPQRKRNTRPKQVRVAPSKWRRRKKIKFRFIDLFAGIGGMRLALEKIGGGCVYACEIDRYARKTYLENFEVPNSFVFSEDINQVTRELKRNPNVVPDHDLLVAGFPCQPFSQAGVATRNALGRPHGFHCPDQGNLFYRIMEILNKKQPGAFLLENVRHLPGHDKGRTFKKILKMLKRKYQVQWGLVNANHHDLPQNRVRIFLAGFHKELRTPTELCWAKEKHVNSAQGASRLRSILEDESEMDINRYRLTGGVWRALKRHKQAHKKAGNGFGFSMVTEHDVARTLTARYYKDGAEILIDRGKYRRPRRLTPRECAKLMGFPDCPKFQIPVSDTQAYRQFGNSVAVPVVKYIAEKMLPDLERIVASRTTRNRKR